MSMAWSAVAVSVAGSMYASSSAASGQMKSASSSAKEYNISLEKQYLHSIVRNSYQSGLLNVQLGLQKKKAAQEGFDQTVLAKAALGQAVASSAATGTVGASVDAVQNDIEMKLGEARAVSADNYEQMLDNYNSELMLNKINATSETIAQNPAKVNYSGPSMGSMLGSALLSGMAQGFGVMAKDSMKLWLGAKVGSTSGTIGGLGGGVRGGLSVPNYKWG